MEHRTNPEAAPSGLLDAFLARLDRVKSGPDGGFVAACPVEGHGKGRGDQRRR